MFGYLYQAESMTSSSFDHPSSSLIHPPHSFEYTFQEAFEDCHTFLRWPLLAFFSTFFVTLTMFRWSPMVAAAKSSQKDWPRPPVIRKVFTSHFWHFLIKPVSVAPSSSDWQWTSSRDNFLTGRVWRAIKSATLSQPVWSSTFSTGRRSQESDSLKISKMSRKPAQLTTWSSSPARPVGVSSSARFRLVSGFSRSQSGQLNAT